LQRFIAYRNDFCPLQEGDFLVVQRENLFMGSLYLAKGKAFEKMGNLSKI